MKCCRRVYIALDRPAATHGRAATASWRRLQRTLTEGRGKMLPTR